MMLTPEQLAAVAKINFGDAMAQTTVKKLLAHVEAQQARIAEADANNTELLHLLAQIREACGDNGKRMQDELVAYIGELASDAARYRYISNGCTVILPDGAECEDQQQLDAAMQHTWPEDASDYGSRIAVVGQNGNDGLHYWEGKP